MNLMSKKDLKRYYLDESYLYIRKKGVLNRQVEVVSLQHLSAVEWAKKILLWMILIGLAISGTCGFFIYWNFNIFLVVGIFIGLGISVAGYFVGPKSIMIHIDSGKKIILPGMQYEKFLAFLKETSKSGALPAYLNP